MSRSRLKMTGAVVALAAAVAVTGCQPSDSGTPAGCPPPAFESGATCFFTPAPSTSPCPPGRHREHDATDPDPSDWGCLITGTLQPGQEPPVPVPIPLPSPSAAPAASLDAHKESQ